MTAIKGIGLREVIALLVLAVALLIGVAFCNPASTDGTPARRQTETAVAGLTLEGVAPWSITYIEGADLESAVVIGQGELPVLDLAYEAGPFSDVKDDAWAVFASTTITSPPGRYLLDLDYEGEIQVLINGEDRKVTPAEGKGAIIIPFEQAEGGTTSISLRLRDTGGPTRLAATIRQ